MLDAFIMEFKVCDERTEKSLEPAQPLPSPCPCPLFLPRSIDVISGSIHVQNDITTKIMVW